MYKHSPAYPFGLPDSLPFLFNGGEEGAIYDPSILSSLYQDSAKTTPVAAYGDPVGAIEDQTSNGNDALQATSGSRPLYARMPKTGIRNLLTDTATLATQNYTTTAVAHTLSFYGTGTVTLSGTSTDGPLVGTGANDRVTLTFTPTAGTLTLTVSGSVTSAQLEIGSSATAYQLVGANRYDISESGIEDVYYLNFDGTDDYLTISGSASTFKFMHDGTGGFFAGAFSVDTGDDAANNALVASKNILTEVGVRWLCFDAFTDDAKPQLTIANGTSNIVLIAGDNQDIPRSTTFITSFQYTVASSPNAELSIDGVLEASGDDTGTPSAASSTYDMTLMAINSGLYTNGKFFGCMFIARVPADAEAYLIDRVYSGKTGASL